VISEAGDLDSATSAGLIKVKNSGFDSCDACRDGKKPETRDSADECRDGKVKNSGFYDECRDNKVKNSGKEIGCGD